MRKTVKCTFLLFFSFTFFSAQDYPSNQYLMFLDARTQDIKIIENDSILYTNNFKNPQKLNKGLYPERIAAYKYQFNIHQKNYFVNDGGGCVLEFSNGQVKRIDHSFLHKNQYGGSEFQYKNEIYLFGGYGLFTLKNIITRYDFNSGEWIQIPCKSDEKPFPGNNYKKILIGDDFYIFDGLKGKKTGIGNEKNLPNTVWKFNLIDGVWKKLGEVHLKYDINFEVSENRNTFNKGNQMYIFDNVYSAIIDLKENRITYYKTKVIIKNTYVIFNPNNQTINFLDTRSSNRKTELVTLPLSVVMNNPIDSETFYRPSLFSKDRLMYSSFALLALLFVPIYFYRKSRKKESRMGFSKDSVIVYRTSENRFYYKGNLLQELSALELSVLEYMAQNVENYNSIHNINFIIEQEMNGQNMNTLLRKREAVLNGIKTKISLIMNVGFNEVILEQKNIQDRRIKEIKLNEELFRIEE